MLYILKLDCINNTILLTKTINKTKLRPTINFIELVNIPPYVVNCLCNSHLNILKIRIMTF